MPAQMEYLTIGTVGNGEYTEKKSRFIGEIHPVSTEEEAAAVEEEAETSDQEENTQEEAEEGLAEEELSEEELTEEELREFIVANIAKHKVPRYIRFVDSFPMNAAGKILKYKMREEASERLGIKK